MFKSVAQTILTYLMSCFLLPKGLCQSLASAVAYFWWINNSNISGMHWMSWKENVFIQKRWGDWFQVIQRVQSCLAGKATLATE